MQYGYIRVSSREQNIDRQADAFGAYRLDKIFIDKQSGKDFDRPAYRQMIKCLHKGDLVIIKSIDRLGRNYDEILEQWRIITKVRRADIFVIDLPLLDTRSRDKDLTGTFIADLVLQILSYVAQTEREFIHQRQAEGIASAKARGVKFGREKVELPPGFYDARDKYLSGEMSIRKAAELCGMNYGTFYSKVKNNSKKSLKKVDLN